MYIVMFNKKKTLRLGRAHDVEININDISVSRLHANLKLVKNIILTNRLVMIFISRIKNQNLVR